ncbi:ABC transporter permease [Microbacterium sp.]|uniref:ABC transporter permease n=1 Tax=Microbacterium sp. TaxID=51671 RepID=UPI003A933001
MIQQLGLLAILVLALIVFSATAPNFFSVINIENILRQAAFAGIIAMGMTLVIVAGEIDISVGSAVAFACALMGVLFERGWDIWLAMLLVLVAGTAVGAFAGFVRARFGVPSFITTLALFLSLRGVAEMITDTRTIPVPSPVLEAMNASYLGLPFPVWVFLAVMIVFAWISTATVFGRSVYAIGGNPHAARLSGLSVTRVRVIVFALTGFLAAITGILTTARIGVGTSVVGNGLEFSVIAAVIIGGTSLAGGRGSIIGSVLGVLFVVVLGNALVLYGVGSSAQLAVQGAVVLIAVLINSIRRDRRHD